MSFSSSAAVSPEWLLDGTSINFVVGGQVAYTLDADEVFPFGTGTIEALEAMRSTPYFTADVIVHLMAYLAEGDMAIQEALDAARFA